ncbi:MAG: hypothetical protein VX481_02905 [Cyanobacteriota bacterium]|nr:hypothetical protein [Cyanobacteriota bacterium]
MGFVLVAAGVGWSAMARIPITVNAVGALLPVSTINTIPSRAEGKAIWTFNQASRDWHQSAFRFSLRPEEFNAEQVVKLAEDLLNDSDVTASGEGIDAQNNSTEFVEKQKSLLGTQLPKGRLILWIQSNSIEQRLTVALMQWKSLQDSTTKKTDNLKTEIKTLKTELVSRNQMLAKMRGIGTDVFSADTLLDEQSNVDSLKAQILNVESQILALDQEKTNGYLNLKNILSDVVDDELIFAEEPLYLYQVIPNDSEEVSAGEIVLKVSPDLVKSPSLVPVFVDNTDKGSVSAGMSALVTPVGFNRTEYGGIKGEVASVAPVPSTVDGMEARVGVTSIARSIEARMVAPTLVILKLEKSTGQDVVNSGGYQWSTSTDLPFQPREGSKINVEITTRYVSPISLVLPTVKKFFGFSPPDSLNSEPTATEP